MEGTTQKMCSFNTDTNELQNPKTHKQFRCFSFPKLAENYPPGFLKKVLAEIIGTYLLVFVGSGSAALNAIDENKVSKLAASLAGGFIVTVMIYAIGHISGAHMNPAVSFAFAAVRHFPWKQVPFYIAAQLTGAISASCTLRVLLEPAKQLGATSPSGSNIQALIMEMVATFTMVFISTAVAYDTKAIGELAGVAVGSSVSIASIVAGPISGGSMNPARTLGPAIASASYKGIWVYLVGPVTGALLGAWSYSAIQETEKPSPSISFNLRRLLMINKTEQVGNNDHLSSVLFYITAQLTGAISASYTLRVLLEPAKQLGATSPSGSNIQALIMEMMATFTMVFISTAVAYDTKAIGELAGVAVGSSVSIASIVAGPISGGSMNPARTLGPAIASASYKGIWVYLVGPVTGALLGAWSYSAIQETDKPAPSILFNLRRLLMINKTEQVGNNDHLSSV